MVARLLVTLQPKDNPESYTVRDLRDVFKIDVVAISVEDREAMCDLFRTHCQD